ncbi:MAG: hypothetical protein AB1938_04030 [Myxococcota bacterium]
MNRTLLVVALSCAALALAGCSTSLCDRNAQLDLAKKAGDCTGVPTSPLLGSASSCSMKISSCSSADQESLTRALDCIEKLPVCSASSRDAYLLSLGACTDPLESLSQPCLDAFFMGVPPGEDGGIDAGQIDAGPQPINDGGNGVVLIAVADESAYAFAWSTRQPGDVAVWQLIGSDTAGVRDPEQDLGPGSLSDYLIPDSGLVIPDAGPTSHRYFLVGRDTNGEIVSGNLDAGTGTDAGMAMCQRSTDCPVDRVCDLGQCKTQTCMTGSTTCPAGYQCLSLVCTRTTSDGGGFDAGFVRPDAGTIDRALPFVSNEVTLTSGPAVFTSDINLGGFPARRPSITGIDTARVFVSLEQEATLVAHASSQRGKDFSNDALTSFPLDTVGTRARTTYNPDSKLTFACYNVGRGVRVQRSSDFGRTWGVAATTIEPFDDGGLSSTIQDCDIAPWKNGGAIMVTVEDDTLAVRTISTGLSVDTPVTAFASNPSGYFSPAHPAIATLPSDSIVHVTFTALRTVGGGTQDLEAVGVYRDGTLGAFTQAQSLVGIPVANAQDWTSVAVDPKSKRALGAFVSVEPGPGAAPVSTVYAAMWNPTNKQWVSGPDLSVFASQQNTTLLFPNKSPATDVWFAFSSSVAILPSGKAWLSFVVGPRTGTTGDYKMVAVPFDFDATSPLSTGKGWFVPPVTYVSDIRVFDPRGSVSNPQPPVSALSADRQLSIYGAFIEGLGLNGEIEGRAIFFSRP